MNPKDYIAEHVRGLPRSGIRDFFAIVSEMPQAISLGIGEPDFYYSVENKESSIFALEKGKTSYTDNRGLLSLRNEISAYVEKNFGPAYDPKSEVLVTVGVSEAIDIALRSLLNPGTKFSTMNLAMFLMLPAYHWPWEKLFLLRLTLRIHLHLILMRLNGHGNLAAKY